MRRWAWWRSCCARCRRRGAGGVRSRSLQARLAQTPPCGKELLICGVGLGSEGRERACLPGRAGHAARPVTAQDVWQRGSSAGTDGDWARPHSTVGLEQLGAIKGLGF